MRTSRTGWDDFMTILGIVVMGGAIALLIFIGTHAPCSMYKYTPAKDVPARCMKEFTK